MGSRRRAAAGAGRVRRPRQSHVALVVRASSLHTSGRREACTTIRFPSVNRPGRGHMRLPRYGGYAIAMREATFGGRVAMTLHGPNAIAFGIAWVSPASSSTATTSGATS